jgi:hypothetical protein
MTFYLHQNTRSYLNIFLKLSEEKKLQINIHENRVKSNELLEFQCQFSKCIEHVYNIDNVDNNQMYSRSSTQTTTIFQQAYVTYKVLKFLQAPHSTWLLNRRKIKFRLQLNLVINLSFYYLFNNSVYFVLFKKTLTPLYDPTLDPDVVFILRICLLHNNYWWEEALLLVSACMMKSCTKHFKYQ